VFDLNKTGELDRLCDNSRFLGVFARCHFQQLLYQNGIDILQKLIKKNSKIPCISYEDKYDKWSNYHDIGYVYCAFGQIENAIKYSKKASELAIKFDLDIKMKMLSYSNVLCFYDYRYYNHADIYKEYMKINQYYPDKGKPFFIKSGAKTKIRIGYLSSDFVYHSVANFILPILENHNRAEFEIVLFANSAEIADIFRGYTLVYINSLDDASAAQMISSKNIDVLFDLNGHTTGNRLGIFAYHPARTQISYIGYPNTTGLSAIKYRITDAIADHPDTLQQYSEMLVRLPRCFLLYKSLVPATTPKKTESTIILGAINKENKNTEQTLALWRRVLQECPNTKIMLKLESFDNRQSRLSYYSEQLGVNSDRIILLNKLPNDEYNKLFTRMDILLDPFPYSGTTTTCNALFHSIPVVSLYHKDYHVHNVSSSILINSGLPELVAKSEQEYLDIIKNLYRNPDKIDEYKRGIHGRFMNLMNPRPFMTSYETVIKNIHASK